MHRRTDNVKTVYPPQTKFAGGINIAECSKGAFCNNFDPKLPVVIKIFVLSIFEWLFYTGFTV